MLLAIDTETELMRAGVAAPRLVCVSFASEHERGLLHWTESEPYLCRWLSDSTTVFVGAKMHYDTVVLARQFPSLLDSIFAAYERDQIHCVQQAQRLLDIANGHKRRSYSLAALTELHTGRKLAKGEDTWRLRYGELRGTPVEQWPSDAIAYAMDDASETLEVAQHTVLHPDVRDSAKQARTAFALQLMTARGIRTDGPYYTELHRQLELELARCRALCIEHGLIVQSTKVKRDGTTERKETKKKAAAQKRLVAALPSDVRERLDTAIAESKAFAHKDMQAKRERVKATYGLSGSKLDKAIKRAVKLRAADDTVAGRAKQWHAWGYMQGLFGEALNLAPKPRPFKALGVTLTKTGQISVNAEACRSSNDHVLKAFAMHTSANAMLQKVKVMERGGEIPLQTDYLNPLDTGRVSSRAPSKQVGMVGGNFMNFNRKALHSEETGEDIPGIREGIVARPGFVLCSIDLDSAEMRAYAQLEYSLLGRSNLRDVLNAGKSPHKWLACKILGCTYEQIETRLKAKDHEAKNAVQFAKIPNFALLGGGGWKILPDYAKGMGIDLTDAQAKTLFEVFHTSWDTVKQAHKHFKAFVRNQYEAPITRRLRYVDRYTQACNGPFQILIADAATDALWAVTRECYVGSLVGSYPILFLHDEIVIELQESAASEHAWRAAKLMIDACNRYLPDVPMTATPALMRRFSKSAETILHESELDSDGNRKVLVYES